MKKEEIIFMPGTKLVQLKLDGRKKIELTDQEGKSIGIKASKAKEIFGEIEVRKILFDDIYLVDAVFNKELFKNSNCVCPETGRYHERKCSDCLSSAYYFSGEEVSYNLCAYTNRAKGGFK